MKIIDNTPICQQIKAHPRCGSPRCGGKWWKKNRKNKNAVTDKKILTSAPMYR